MHNKIKTQQLLEQLLSLVSVNKITSEHGYFTITDESSQSMIAKNFLVKEVK